MQKVYNFIWCYKYHLALFTIATILICSLKLRDFKIFFESERIINELTVEKLESAGFKKNLDDENIILVSIKNDKIIDYKLAGKLKKQIELIVEIDEVKRVFTLFNEKYFPSSGLIPIPKNKLSLASISDFNKTLDAESLFLSQDKKSTFAIIEIDKEILKNAESTLNSIKYLLNDHETTVKFAGRMPSETYFQKNATKEFIVLSIFSCILCLSIIFFYTKNPAIVIVSFVCVLVTILVSTSLSLFLFGGIELFMIISPAIFFIVTVSDVMHLTNNQDYSKKDKRLIFLSKMNSIGVPVLITSLTTMISFFSFAFINIKPLRNFGLITGIGVFIALYISVLAYSFIVDFNFNKSKPYEAAERIINSTTEIIVNHRYFFSIFVICIIVASVFQLNRIKIDNYLLDELNPSSEFYQESKFIDENFGGIKPVSIFIDSSETSQFKKLDFITHLDSLDVSVDFSNETEQKRKLYKYLFRDKSTQLKYNCRISDIGSYASNNLYNKIDAFDEKTEIHFTGIGYLFDTTSDMLTKKLLIGLVFAIFTVGAFLCLAFGFNLKLFLLE